jgi:hypothetical protein
MRIFDFGAISDLTAVAGVPSQSARAGFDAHQRPKPTAERPGADICALSGIRGPKKYVVNRIYMCITTLFVIDCLYCRFA